MSLSTDLYKVTNLCYIVKSNKLTELCMFSTIDQAADFLEKELGIPGDEVDIAIVDMAVQGNTHAQFGVLEGRFMYSDKEILGDHVGIA